MASYLKTSALETIFGEPPAESEDAGEEKPQWQRLAAGKRRANLAKIPQEWHLPRSVLENIHEGSDISVLNVPRTCGLLTAEEFHITEDYDATGLLEQLSQGSLKAYDVVTAFCKRAAIAHQTTNCLTEIFFDQAQARAKLLDEFWAREKKPIGPLHGIPISLKDSYMVKDVHHTCGYISFLEKPPAENNSPIVQTLLNLGAVLYVKTNIPQTFMTADSENNVFGRTLNPRRLTLTAGGSSGGEGALIAMRGSLLGVATDVAGSIRIPAFCNGIYGFKPTANRMPFGYNAVPGRLGSPSPIVPLAGPLATTTRDCVLLLRSVIDSDPWLLDDGVLNVPWRALPPPTTSTSTRSLRLGLITEDPTTPLHPPVLRALRTASAALTTAGHTLIPLDTVAPSLPSLTTIAALAWKFFALDPQKTALRFVTAGCEPLIRSLSTIRIPANDGWEPSLDALFDLVVARKQIVKAFHDVVVREGLDAVVMAPHCATAVPHDTYGMAGHTVLANVLDWPAAVVPFGVAEESADAAFVREGVRYKPEYRAAEVEGMPCAIQVLGRPMRDEELVRDLGIIEAALRKSG
ncbi:Amidase [Macrophomina phaseolina MS6]|uniref:amidase n=1 Tax=Macrophomina phaseolina (strain MS6) TaxID=1126212 RepID=K2S5A6_MACPH|nr:Amidase [Macrophomina phaseolina MS6]